MIFFDCEALVYPILEGCLPRIQDSVVEGGAAFYLNSKNEIIYIGKAKNLKKRVSNYKNTSSLSNRIQRMVHQINSIETITTKTEAEAFLLESNLIKKKQTKI